MGPPIISYGRYDGLLVVLWVLTPRLAIFTGEALSAYQLETVLTPA